MVVDGERLNRRIGELAVIGGNASGGVTRLAYSEADLQACAWIEEVMSAAGLEVHVDAAGNRVGRRAGREGGLPPIVMGSHIDSVAGGGRYDGPVGSLAAVEVAQSLGEQGVTTRHPLEVIIFQNEEYGHVGSRALAGDLSEADLRVVNGSGRTRSEGITFLGGDPSKLDSVRRHPGDVARFWRFTSSRERSSPRPASTSVSWTVSPAFSAGRWRCRVGRITPGRRPWTGDRMRSWRPLALSRR